MTPAARRILLGLATLAAPAGALAQQPPAAPAPSPAQQTQPSPPPAQPAPMDFTVYGTLLEFADSARTTGASAPGLAGGASLVGAPAYTGVNLPTRVRLTSGTSNIGFKGGYQLTPSVRAIFQVESAVSPDGDAPNAWAARNSHVGLTGPWGTAFYGQWDTPYKVPILFVGPLRGLNPFDDLVIANPGFNTPGTVTQTGRGNTRADTSFNRRQGNSVQYWSPTLYGVSARLAYGFAESKTLPSQTAGSYSPAVYSGSLAYDWKTLGVRYAFERHDDYFGLAQMGGAQPSLTNPASTDDAHAVTVFYTLPTGTKVSGIVERLSYTSEDTAPGSVDAFRRNAFYLLLQQRVGSHQVWGSYGQALEGSCEREGGEACSTEGLGGSQLALGYSYALGKSVDVYAAAYRNQNGASASFAGFPPMGTVAPGADTTGFGLGVLYTFSATWPKAP